MAENLPKELAEGNVTQQKKEYLMQMDDDETVMGISKSKDENVASASASTKEAEDWKTISAHKSPEVSSSPRG